MHRWQVQNQLGPTHSQTMQVKKRPTRKMVAKLQTLQTRNQFENVATRHHLDLEMVQLVTTRMFSPRVKRPSIPRTTFPFIVFRVLLMSSFNMLKDSQKMSDIYFHTDITLVDGSTLQDGEWPSVP